jgi:hypothetical protein
MHFFLNPFTVCLSDKRKFVVCPFVDYETKGKLSVQNVFNRLNRLAHPCPPCWASVSMSMPDLRVHSMLDIRVHVHVHVHVYVYVYVYASYMSISGPISAYISMSMSKSKVPKHESTEFPTPTFRRVHCAKRERR